MGEATLDLQKITQLLKPLLELRNIITDKPKTSHTGIKLDMNVIRGSWRSRLKVFGKEVEDTERVDIRLQVVSNNVVKTCRLWVHNHYGQRNAAAMELDSLVNIGDGKVVDMIVLECGGNGEKSGTIGICLDHCHQARVGTEKRTVVIEVMDKRIEVDFEDSLMAFLLEACGDILKMEGSCTFQQNSFIPESIGCKLLEEVFCCRMEGWIKRCKKLPMKIQCGTHSDKAVNLMTAQELCEILVSLWGGVVGEVTEDKRTVWMEVLMIEGIKGNVKGGCIKGVTIIDKECIIDTFKEFKPHLYRCKSGTTLGNNLGRIPKVVHKRYTMHGIFLRSTVSEGYADEEGMTFGSKCKGGCTSIDLGAKKSHLAMLSSTPCICIGQRILFISNHVGAMDK